MHRLKHAARKMDIGEKMRKTLLATVVLFMTTSVAVAQLPDPAVVDGIGFNQDRLSRIDSVINAEIASGKIPGAVALIAKGGKLAYLKSFGYSDIQSKADMATDNIFRLASMTKAITSVGVMILYERGLFQLNDPVANYIPEFSEMDVVSSVDADGNVSSTKSATTPIRIVDLLTHSSGISYPFAMSSVQSSYVNAGIIDGLTGRNIVLADQMKTLASQPLLFEPGSDYEYGLSTDVLGYLIEVVSGKPLDQFFSSEILTPLGMKDTYFYLPNAKADRLVTLYAEDDHGDLIVSRGDESNIILDDPEYPVGDVQTYFSGGAGLSSTAYDYALFLQMLLNEGELDGIRILSRKSVELMRSPRVDANGDGTADFGLGFDVTVDLGRAGELGSLGNYEWSGAFQTSYWLDPQEQLFAVFMSQVRPSQSDIRAKFKTMVYQALD
jgi:CubicO group peptidase (beta-lactamase class C family)